MSPRPPRIEYSGALYYVMNRTARRKPVFAKKENRAVFLRALAETVHRMRIRLHAASFGPDRTHLLLETPFANLSESMRLINGLSTQRINRLRKKTGPLFRGRFKAILLDKEVYRRAFIRYVRSRGRRPSKLISRLLSRKNWPSAAGGLGFLEDIRQRRLRWRRC